MLHDWAKDNFIWLYTEEILDEYKEVLKRLHVRPNVIGNVINLIRERAEAIEVRFSVEISPDPKDDSFCLCAEEGNAEFIFKSGRIGALEDFQAERNGSGETARKAGRAGLL